MSYFDPIRKDFQFQLGGKAGKVLRGINWFLKQINKPPITMAGVYKPNTGEATVFLNAFTKLMDNPEVSEEKVVDLLSDTLTHEYLHKITMEDPVFAREWQEWKKANTSNFVHAKMKDANAQELVAYGMMDNEIQALDGLSQHYSVDDNIREAAAKVVSELRTKAKENDMKTIAWAKEHGITPRLKMWEFVEASNKGTNVNISKFDSLHHSATMQGSVNADDDSWFNILRMGGAVTTTATGTSTLFNNKTGGGKRRGSKKKARKKKERYGSKTT